MPRSQRASHSSSEHHSSKSSSGDGNLTVFQRAVKYIERAVNYERQKNYGQAIIKYSAGIDLLMEAMKAEQHPDVKGQIKLKTVEYMQRVEELKNVVGVQSRNSQAPAPRREGDSSSGARDAGRSSSSSDMRKSQPIIKVGLERPRADARRLFEATWSGKPDTRSVVNGCERNHTLMECLTELRQMGLFNPKETKALDKAMERLPTLLCAKTDGLRAIWIYTLQKVGIAKKINKILREAKDVSKVPAAWQSYTVWLLEGLSQCPQVTGKFRAVSFESTFNVNLGQKLYCDSFQRCVYHSNAMSQFARGAFLLNIEGTARDISTISACQKTMDVLLEPGRKFQVMTVSLRSQLGARALMEVELRKERVNLMPLETYKAPQAPERVFKTPSSPPTKFRPPMPRPRSDSSSSAQGLILPAGQKRKLMLKPQTRMVPVLSSAMNPAARLAAERRRARKQKRQYLLEYDSTSDLQSIDEHSEVGIDAKKVLADHLQANEAESSTLY